MYMKISRSSGTCLIAFENKDQFAGKELLLEGERIQGGFQFNGNLIWLIPDEAGKVCGAG